MRRRIAWSRLITILLILVFAAGALLNLIAPPPIVEDYARWGYPGWFHFITAACELATAILLGRRMTRSLGITLGNVVMFAATAILIVHGEWAHAIGPVAILLLLTSLATRTRRERGRPFPT